MKILLPLFACCTRLGGAGLSLLTILCLLATPMRAQVVEKWVQRYNGPANGNDYPTPIAMDSAGNVFVSGTSFSSGINSDYYTAKYAAADGGLLWEKRYDGPANNYDYATCLALDSAGNVAVSGFSRNAANADFYTAKYAAADGALLWERRYNGPANHIDEASAIAMDSAGNVIVTGVSSNGSNADYYTAKYAAADGALLWEKRYNGPGNSYDAANSLALDSAGNVTVTGPSVNADFNFDYYTARYAAADGALLWEKRYNGTANSGDEAKDIAIDSAGNVTVTGLSSNGTNNDYYTAKYAADDGALLWEQRYNGPANNTDEARAIAVDSAGNVAVTGSSSSGTTPDIYTAKYTAADGTLLWEKRYNGTANNYDEASSIVMDSAGNVAIGGLSIGPDTGFDYYTARYAAAGGALLWEKRYDGPASGNDYVSGITGDNAGNVVVTGVSFSSSTSNDYYTIKYGPMPNPLDPGFSADGLQTTPVGAGAAFGQAAAVQGDGKIVVAGYSHNGSDDDFAVARYLPNGDLDTTFNGTGKVTTPIGGGNDRGRSVAIQGDGKLLVAGFSSNGSNHDFALVRYLANGTLDTTFNGTGKVTTPIGADDEQAVSVTVQADGKIVAAGYSVSGANTSFATVRYLADGTLDTTFNGTGKVTTPIGGSADFGRSVVVQSDGKIVVGGHAFNGTTDDFAMVRYLADGTLDTSFNGTGKVMTDIAGRNQYGQSIALQPDGKLLLTGSTDNGTNHDFALVRYLTNGSLDTSFNGTGKVTTAIGSNADVATSVAVQGNGKILIAGYANNGSNDDFVLVRYKTNGTLDTTFNETGKAMTAIGGGDDQGFGIALQSDGNIVVAGSAFNGSHYDFAVARYLGDGITGLPTLTAPATNATTANPVGVAFTLPDAALPGSVTLTFTGVVTRTLVLAASLETSGAHGFGFDPANPIASAEIVSGSAIPDGTYTVALSYQDDLANPAATASATGVVLDTTPPVLSAVMIASSNMNPAWAKVGDMVTVSFTANEPIQPPVVTLLGVAATVANPVGNQWTASAPVGAATAQGSATFSIVATDMPGNAANAIVAPTDASLVNVDRTAPTLSLPANITVAAMSLAGAAVSFTASATDNLDLAPGVLASPASGSIFPIGATTVNASARDAAGNSASGNFSVKVQDRTHAPVFTNAGTVPLIANGFTATGLSVGAVTLGFDPAGGQVLTLVENTSANPIGGTFTDLPNGGAVLTNYGGRDLLFVVSYTGGDGNDVTLTLLAPEIAVEQPAGTDIADGGTKNFGTVLAGTSASLTFTIRNTGAGILNGLTFTKTGADQAAFTITAAPVAPVAGPAGGTTFTVRFSPVTSGAKTAAIHLASDDADENPLDITLTGRALSASEDTDSDGLNDAAEFLLAALGYDWQVSQPALVGTLVANANVAGLFTQAQMDANRQAGQDDVLNAPNTFSLYTLSQIQALHLGTPLLTQNPQTGKFTLTIGIKKSADLLQYDPFPFTGPGTTINGQGQVEFEFTAPGDAAFFRLEAR